MLNVELRLPGSKPVSEEMLKPPSLWRFVTAAPQTSLCPGQAFLQPESHKKWKRLLSIFSPWASEDLNNPRKVHPCAAQKNGLGEHQGGSCYGQSEVAQGKALCCQGWDRVPQARTAGKGESSCLLPTLHLHLSAEPALVSLSTPEPCLL